jgi:dipeptidyl aminopeptidase/acylaminoacyl peptidase
MQRITEQTLYDMKFVGNPQFSPDGQWIVYVHTTLSEKDNAYHSTLRAIHRQTGANTQLTYAMGKNGVAADKVPQFSPDGSQLAFISNRTGKPQLYVMSFSGGEPRQVTCFKKGVKSFAWSPASDAFVVTARADDPEDRSDVQVVKQLRYWGNGEGFYGDTPVHLWTIKADGTDLQPLTEGVYDEKDPAFSPDGQKVAFISWRKADQRTVTPSLYTIDVNTREIAQVYEGKGIISTLTYSPDGQWIAFVGHEQSETSGANSHVFVVSANGGEARDITLNFDRSVGNFVGTDARYETWTHRAVWSEDSRTLYFLVTDGGNCHVYSASLGGAGKPMRRTPDEPVVVNSFTVHGDEIVTAMEIPTCIAELYEQTDSTVKPLTDHNGSLFADLMVATPEPVFAKAQDGLDLEGWVLKPADFDANKKYPLVLEIHGGPHTAYGNTFHHEFQVLAAHGYVVLYTNPRGSQGYGQDFLRGCIGDWGGNDYQDIMDVLNHLLATESYLDEGQLNVTGGSYGGYMTNWIVGQDTRFRAAVTQRSISNLYSMFGTSDIGFFFNSSELGEVDLWKDEDFIMSRSPIRYAKNVRTPMKIIHSEQDIRCPMEQAEQWFIALKRLGIDTELVRFPDENHELSRSGKPKHRIERLQHIVGWFDKYR